METVMPSEGRIHIKIPFAEIKSYYCALIVHVLVIVA